MKCALMHIILLRRIRWCYDINEGFKNAFRNLARSEIKYTSESSLNITVDEDNEIEDLLRDSLDLEEYIINSYATLYAHWSIPSVNDMMENFKNSSYLSNNILKKQLVSNFAIKIMIKKLRRQRLQS